MGRGSAVGSMTKVCGRRQRRKADPSYLLCAASEYETQQSKVEAINGWSTEEQ